MSYPKTSEQRLIQLYGYTQEDLLKIYVECGKDKSKYIQRVEEIDKQQSLLCYNTMMDENTFLH